MCFVIPEIEWCVFDSVECYHSCEGCKHGFIICSGCGTVVEWNENQCSCCGLKKENSNKIIYEGT